MGCYARNTNTIAINIRTASQHDHHQINYKRQGWLFKHRSTMNCSATKKDCDSQMAWYAYKPLQHVQFLPINYALCWAVLSVKVLACQRFCVSTPAESMLCRKIVKETVDKFGQLDVLVNNASFQGKDVEKFEDITRERLEFTFHSNILAYFTVAQAAVPHMPKGSAIININSIQGYQPAFGVLDYACTKVLFLTAFCC